MNKFNLIVLAGLLLSCASNTNSESEEVINTDSVAVMDTLPIEIPMYCNATTKVGAEQTEEYFEKLRGKNIGVVGNQSSMIKETHLVDSLLNAGINVVSVFSPEHGFRGTADAGEKVNDGKDERTGVPIVSLYGKNKKPTKEQLKGIDVLLFDIQDVGVRFYTYISTLHYIMEAAAESGIEVIVLDRPNPNGHYVDGPILKDDYASFIGMHKVPVVHGMTVGEYAQMINGEKWLAGGVHCDLSVVMCKGWDHSKFYKLPLAPSPNLPNMTAVYLYPSLCFFEGTIVSIGRGTDNPFQMIGHPNYGLGKQDSVFKFIPKPNQGAKHPKLEGEKCSGVDLHETDVKALREKGELDLAYLFDFYNDLAVGKSFFLKNNFIDLLAGTNDLQQKMLEGQSFDDYKKSWAQDLEAFKLKREEYLLYPLN